MHPRRPSRCRRHRHGRAEPSRGGPAARRQQDPRLRHRPQPRRQRLDPRALPRDRRRQSGASAARHLGLLQAQLLGDPARQHRRHLGQGGQRQPGGRRHPAAGVRHRRLPALGVELLSPRPRIRLTRHHPGPSPG